jgi:hypothetical protein
VSHLNFNIRAAEIQAPARAFEPRGNVSFDPMSVLWAAFAAAAVAGATFGIIWFA